MEIEVLTGEQRERFEGLLRADSAWYLRGRKLWSFAHHSTLFVSAISSAAAAVILQLQGLDSAYQENLASALAGLAAVLVAVNTSGGFSKKWQANRLSRRKVERLENELIARDPTRADIEKLTQIGDEHSAAIAGA